MAAPLREPDIEAVTPVAIGMVIGVVGGTITVGASHVLESVEAAVKVVQVDVEPAVVKPLEDTRKLKPAVPPTLASIEKAALRGLVEEREFTLEKPAALVLEPSTLKTVPEAATHGAMDAAQSAMFSADVVAVHVGLIDQAPVLPMSPLGFLLVHHQITEAAFSPTQNWKDTEAVTATYA